MFDWIPEEVWAKVTEKKGLHALESRAVSASAQSVVHADAASVRSAPVTLLDRKEAQHEKKQIGTPDKKGIQTNDLGDDSGSAKSANTCATASGKAGKPNAAQKYVESLNILSILSGEKLGRTATPARDMSDKWIKSEDPKTKAMGQLLKAHILVVDAAERLVDNLEGLGDQEFHKSMEPIIESGVPFPTAFKQSLHKRYIGKLLSNKQYAELFIVAVPWRATGISADAEFHPFQPQGWQVEGAIEENISDLTTLVVDKLLLPCLQKGEGSPEASTQLVEAGLDAFDNVPEDIDSEYDVPVSHLISAFRGIAALASPIPGAAGSSKKDVELLMVTAFQKPMSNEHPWLAQIGAVLKSTEPWKDFYQNYKETEAATSQAWPSIERGMALTAPFDFAKVCDLVEQITAWRIDLRQGCLVAFEEKMQNVVSEIAKIARDETVAMDQIILDIFHRLLQSAFVAFPGQKDWQALATDLKQRGQVNLDAEMVGKLIETLDLVYAQDDVSEVIGNVLTNLLTYLLTYLLAYLLTCLLTYLLTYLLAYLLTCLLTYLLTYLLAYLLVHTVPAHLHAFDKFCFISCM